MSLINTEILDFKNPVFHNGEFSEVSKDDVLGKWSVFFFYPGDFTFVCPTELGDLADHYEELQKMGVEVYGVSTDSHFVHKAWHESSEEVGKADRATFLVDPQGIIQYIEQTAEGIGRDASELVRKIKAAQYVAEHPGEVCPAKWEEGQDTLTPGIDLVGKI